MRTFGLILALSGVLLVCGCQSSGTSSTETTATPATNSQKTTPASDNTGKANSDKTADTPAYADPKTAMAMPALKVEGHVKNGVFVNKDGKVICPVLGTVIPDPKKAFSSVVYKGVKYYFCCGGCPDQFKANPAKYAAKTS